MTEIKKKMEILQARIEVRNGENWHGEIEAVGIYHERLAIYEEVEKEISSLITTIESQKLEIVDKDEHIRALRIAKEHEIECHAQSCFDYQDQIESLKAITELAVKGLKQIRNTIDCSPVKTYQKMEEIADTTLSEIERLSHE